MKIFVNKKIKLLFCWIILLIIVFSLLSITFMVLELKNTAWYVFIFSVFIDFLILIAVYWYFNEQNRIIENAVTQIKEYISENQNSHIECDDEGELYRLFHEINSLVSILNTNAEKQSKAKNFLKNIISDISHQLKTPLAALNVYTGIIQEEAKCLPTIKEFSFLLEQELDRIEILVQNLLKIAKLDADTIVIDKSMENVSKMMSNIERHFSYRAELEEKKIYISGDDTITLLCDYNWLIEAISNIVKNSFDNTKKGDIIQIEWKQFASLVQIIIKDNGSGIPPEDLYHIFKRFYRSRFSKDKQGIGLGLPLAKAIIEKHNGTIEVDSKLGIGTMFTINFLIPTKL